MEYIIYAAEVADPEATPEQSKAFAKVYAKALKEAFEEIGLDVAVVVRYDADGFGSGLEGCGDSQLEGAISAVADVVLENEFENYFILSTKEAPIDQASEKKRGRGRPSLGVKTHGIKLTDEQWAWLENQPGGASAAVRRLIEMAQALETGILQDDWVLYQDGETWCISPHERKQAYAANYTGATATEALAMAVKDQARQPRR